MKFLLLALALVLSVQTQAQEETSEDTAQPQIQEPSEHWASCEESYLNYIRGLSSAQQKNELDNWWMLADRDYNSIKNDEFQYKEEKPKKEKELTKLLSEKPETQSLILNIKLGKYDFKKKGFPLDVKVAGQDKTLENHYDGSFSMGGIGGPPSATVVGCTMSLSSKKSETMPSTVKFKPTNLAQLKFWPASEEQGKKITSELGSSRIKSVTVRLNPIKTSLIKKSIGSIKIVELHVASEIKELEFTAGDEKQTVKF